MGYTHYFYISDTIMPDDPRHAVMMRHAQDIVERSTSEGRGATIRTKVDGGPTFYIDGVGKSCETFCWPPTDRLPPFQDRASGFCKTAHYPYDAVVCACLLAAKLVYGNDAEVSSDGEWYKWENGRALFKRVFGHEAECPFEDIESDDDDDIVEE